MPRAVTTAGAQPVGSFQSIAAQGEASMQATKRIARAAAQGGIAESIPASVTATMPMTMPPAAHQKFLAACRRSRDQAARHKGGIVSAAGFS